MTAICGARQPQGVLRCELARNHERERLPVDDHGAYDGKGNWVSWASARAQREDRQQRRGRINRESAKQAYRRGRLDGIRDERLAQQRRASGSAGGYRNWCEHCLETKATEQLRLHHYVHRSIGRRATPEDMGDEHPEQLALICQGPGSCHDDEHPGPWPS